MMEIREFNELIWNREYDKIKELINSNPEYLEFEDEYKRTPLFNLANNGAFEMVKFLVEKGANVNHIEKWGSTALYQALENGFTIIVKYLIDNGADVNIIPQYSSPIINTLYDRAREDNLAEKELDELAIMIMDKLKVIDYSINTFIYKKKDDLLKYAMESGKVSKDAVLGSVGAMFYNDKAKGLETLTYFLDNGYIEYDYKTTHGFTLFQKIANETYSVEALQLLVDRGLDVQENNNVKALLTFAGKGFKDGVKYLVEKLGVDINYIDSNNGYNALHFDSKRYIASYEDELSETFIYLVDNGCDLTLSNNYGQLPLSILFQEKRTKTIKYAFNLTVKAILDKMTESIDTKEEAFNSLFSIMEIAPTKKEKESLVKQFMSFPEYSSKFVEVINDPKLKIRDMAVKTLMSFNQPEHLFALKDRAGVETNKALLKLMNEYIAKNKDTLESLESSKVIRDPKDFKKNSMEYFDVMAENADGNLPVSWLRVNNLPDVLWEKTNKAMDKVTLKYFLKLLKAGKVPTPFMKLINSNSLVELFNVLHEMPKKLKSEDIWIYNILFMLAEDDLSYLTLICEKIDRFVNYSRWAMGASLFTPMAKMKNPAGIKKVDWYSRKVKHKGIKNGAYGALNSKAYSLKMTVEELRDSLISDFGFNEDKELVLDYGTRQITVKLMPDFKYTFKNEEGKIFKTLPKPNKKDNEKKANKSIKFFKDMKKEIRDILKIQKERIEHQFKVNTLKDFGKWEAFFVKNPVLNIFASNLFWGVYDGPQPLKGGKEDKNSSFRRSGGLKTVFRYNEDKTFSDINDDEIKLKKTDKVGLVHPVELKEKELDKLKELIDDYEIVQPLEQVERKFYVTDSKEKELLDFNDLKLYTKSSHYKLTGLGWERGYIVDNGWFEDYHMNLAGVTATLEFSGADMYLEYGEESVTWGKVRFGKTALNKVNKRIYSEVYRTLDIASQTRVK